MPTLEVSDKELAVVKAALDTYMRAQMGRADQAMEEVPLSGVRSDGRDLTPDETGQIRAMLVVVSSLLTGIRHGGPGIFSPQVSPNARLAYRLLARLDGDSLREGMVDAEGQPS